MYVVSSIINLFRLFFLLLLSGFAYFFIKNKAIYSFLRLAGPTFIKAGQILANRPDLAGDNLSNTLSAFQDNLPAFPFKIVKKTIESDFSSNLSELFAEFKEVPIASASIAQVHQAKLNSGEVVAVKILRPNIKNLIERDIRTLKLLACLVGVASRYHKKKILDVINLLKDCSKKELDLFFEGSAASELKDQLKDVKGFYVPKIYWGLVSRRVLTLEWIDGIKFSNREAIRKSSFDKKETAKNLVISYFNQVYNHGFFHADMHGGNLFLMKNGDIGVVDFGIMGIIDKKTRIAITQIIIAFLDRDYRKVAKLHIDSGLVPKNVNLVEFSLSCRVIGEMVVDKAVGQVSMAQLLDSLLKMTKKYQMKTNAELLLLQKTMMLVEGIGVFLDEDLNMWDLSRPFVKEWAVKNIGFDAKIRDGALDLVETLKDLPETISKINKVIIKNGF
jgi:ubiquinone biosynthesis protein